MAQRAACRCRGGCWRRRWRCGATSRCRRRRCRSGRWAGRRACRCNARPPASAATGVLLDQAGDVVVGVGEVEDSRRLDDAGAVGGQGVAEDGGVDVTRGIDELVAAGGRAARGEIRLDYLLAGEVIVFRGARGRAGEVGEYLDAAAGAVVLVLLDDRRTVENFDQVIPRVVGRRVAVLERRHVAGQVIAGGADRGRLFVGRGVGAGGEIVAQRVERPSFLLGAVDAPGDPEAVANRTRVHSICPSCQYRCVSPNPDYWEVAADATHSGSCIRSGCSCPSRAACFRIIFEISFLTSGSGYIRATPRSQPTTSPPRRSRASKVRLNERESLAVVKHELGACRLAAVAAYEEDRTPLEIASREKRELVGRTLVHGRLGCRNSARPRSWRVLEEAVTNQDRPLIPELPRGAILDVPP